MMQPRRPETSAGLGRLIFYPLVTGLGGAIVASKAELPLSHHPIIDMGVGGVIGLFLGTGVAIGHNLWINRDM